MVRATILGVCLLTGCYSGLGDASIASSSEGEGGTGVDGPSDADGGGSDEDTGESFDAAPVPMRRLTRAQFVQSTRDLLAIPQWAPQSDLPDDGLNYEEYQLPNMQASVLTTTGEDYDKYRALAKEAAELAFATDDEMITRMGCTPVAPDDACVRDYLAATAERAFSRVVPGDDAVLASLLSVVEEGHAQLGSVRLGVQWALVALVQCPEFLYVYPSADPDRPGVMDGYSRARVVALMFRDSIPDEVLLARARTGELGDDAALREEIERLIDEMIAEPAQRIAVERFFGEWWGTNVIEAIGKDPIAFPEFDDDLRASMRAEIDALVADIVFDRRGDFHRVLVSDRLWVDDELAALYGIPGAFGSEPQPVSIEADNPRSGLLSTAAFSSIMAHPSQTSPAARGRFVTERLFCERIPPVPPGVDTTIPPAEGPETKRQRFVRHTSDPTCASCHALMDPMGLALEEFDGIGRHRRSETVSFDGQSYEVPLDTTGEIGGVEFADSKQMAALVAEDPRFVECVTHQLLNHALGRELGAAELPALADIGDRFAESGYDYLVLMREAAVHRIFIAFEEGV
jgi:hypothetical protein